MPCVLASNARPVLCDDSKMMIIPAYLMAMVILIVSNGLRHVNFFILSAI